VASVPTPRTTTAMSELRQKCEANPVGANAKRINGTLDLRNAQFQSADLGELDLTDADLWGANLRGAHLEATRGLEARSIGGTDVTGAHLPAEIAEFRGVDVLNDIAPAAATLFLALLGACLYCLITIAATKDNALILDTSTQALPILQTPIPLIGFYALAPLILVILLVYLQLNLQRIWEALATLPAKFPDGRSIDERVYPWVYIQRVRAHYPWLKYTYAARLENVLGSLLGYLAVPATVALSLRRVAVMHSMWLTAWHVALFTLAVLVGLMSWWSSRDAMRGARQNEFPKSLLRWPYAWRSGLALLSAIAVVWAAAGPWHRAPANLRGQDLSSKPSGWTVGSSDISQVTGAGLAGAKLPAADMQNAFLVNANLQGADLRDAKLTGADLRSANLSRADLSGATFEDANLQDATLRGANFGTDTFGVKRLRQAANWPLAHYSQEALTSLGLLLQHEDRLKTGDFHHYPSGEVGILNFRRAALNDTNFSGVDLTTADFTSANLSNANLRACKLTQAKFLNAVLTHCDLSGADLSSATGLTAAQLLNAVLCKDTKLPARLAKLAGEEPCAAPPVQ